MFHLFLLNYWLILQKCKIFVFLVFNKSNRNNFDQTFVEYILGSYCIQRLFLIVLLIQGNILETLVYTPGKTAQPAPKDVTPTWTPFLVKGPPLSPYNRTFKNLCINMTTSWIKLWMDQFTDWKWTRKPTCLCGDRSRIQNDITSSRFILYRIRCHPSDVASTNQLCRLKIT